MTVIPETRLTNKFRYLIFITTTSTEGILVPEGIIRSLFSSSAMVY